MAEGTIKRLTDKGFGFIDAGSDKDMFFHSSNLEGGELRRTSRSTTNVIHRSVWSEGAKSRKRQAGLTELRGTFVFNHGETDMGDKGSKDKGKREQQKKAKRSPKEKRKEKREKRKEE